MTQTPSRRTAALKAYGAGGVVAGALALGMGAARIAEGTRAALGGRPSDERLVRIARSPHWRDGAFHNTRAMATMPTDQLGLLRRMRGSRGRRRPSAVVPLARPGIPGVSSVPVVTWFGHASVLVELGGARILLDPVWGERCSPSRVAGPKRVHPVPVPLAELGPVDAVVISHDHYDHLDRDTIVELARTAAEFVVPLGVGAHLEAWGVAPDRVVELDWDESQTVAGVEVTCVESQHFSGRGVRRDETLWASWVLASPSGRVFFSGDTGFFDGYPAMAAAYGPFDVALMAIGAYDPGWHGIHLDPEEAVRAAVDLGSPLLVPIHWGTFVLAPHPWAEPVERLLPAAGAAGVRVAVPRPGESVDISAPAPVVAWWRQA